MPPAHPAPVRLPLLLGGLVVGALLVGCAGDSAPGSVPLRVVDDEYSPAVVRIPVGGTIEWSFGGTNTHNVIAADFSWRSAEIIPRDGRYIRTFGTAGVFPYFCSFHGTPDGGGMAGVIVVGDDTPLPAAPDGPAPVASPSGVTIAVPADHPTIQQAVDAADPGDLILISPGVYRESVRVTTPSLTIRGLDRNTTILDGGLTLVHAIQVVGADGVAIENLTARYYTLNGFYWTGVTGYRGSYLTVYDVGDYGIYAFDAVDGLIEHSYSSGAVDAAYYVGQCYPCRAVLRDVIGENSGLGYSGTNAGGDLYIVESVFRSNMSGIVPNSLDSELDPPARDNTIVGNLIVGNSNPDAAGAATEFTTFGNGIILAGTVNDRVERNLVVGHDRYGILVTVNLDDNFFFSRSARVADNVVTGSGVADLALAGPAGSGNCFSGNRFRTSAPPGLQLMLPCTGFRFPFGGEYAATFLSLGYVVQSGTGSFPAGDWRTLPAPPAQPQMPDAATAPARPAIDVFVAPDLDSIPLPTLDSLPPLPRQEVLVNGIPVSAPGVWQIVLGLWGYLLPVALLATWVALAVGDLTRRDDLGRPAVIAWLAVVFAIPIAGVVAYHAVGHSQIPRWIRVAVVGGGAAVWVVVLVVSLAIGGVV